MMYTKMGEKLKWSIFIFNLLHCLSSGCEYNDYDCYFEIHCGTADIDLSEITNFNNIYPHCEEISVIRNGYRYRPLRIKIESKYDFDSFERSHDSFYNSIIDSLQITNVQLDTIPNFDEMNNLKMLNLSYTHLHTADLYNNPELISLEFVDLSHNIIRSIKVDVSQNVYKNIRKLNLSHNNLSHIPGEIFELFKSLENLDLSYNKIVIIDHSSFEGLKNLKKISLSHNNISDINVSLYRFTYLEELYLDNNNIENLSRRSFETLTRLEMLDLDFNKISTIEKDTFINTVSLTTLKLHHNLLSHIHKDTFLSTNNLKNIDLSNNLIRNLPIELLRNKNVTSFSIIGNNLEGNIYKGTFDGLQLIVDLDISYQAITALEDFAFFGLAKLETLLLNNNKITVISKHSFDTLLSLKELDLSNNLIVTLDFNTNDLVNLEMFSLNKNLINRILRGVLQNLNRLRFLDISNNNITEIEEGSFNTTESIECLKILNNPLSGALLNNIFVGLHLVSVLDLSHTSLTSIQNGSFSGMVQLLEINISRSTLNELGYSSFTKTGNVITIDLSFNKLTEFIVNGEDLKKLTTLYLNNNQIFQISHKNFKNMNMLNKIVLSYNSIENIDGDSFADLISLNHLDVSFNKNLSFNTWVINNTRTLQTLLLSGVKNITDFTSMGNIPVRQLELSHLKISNISVIRLNIMTYLTNLVLNNNKIAEIQSNALKNVTALVVLDLSFNNISFIQAGTFKYNVFLSNLNLSHNSLTALSYGMFRGLIGLISLDVSFNGLQDLGRDKFYDTPLLRTLIVDHNRITNIKEDFFSINLHFLSIGHNPLPCEKLIALKDRCSFDVSAIDRDENNGDNIDGIVCNIKNHYNFETRIDDKLLNATINEKMLGDIRNILLKLFENRAPQIPVDHEYTELLTNISSKIEKYSNDQSVQLENIKSEIVNEAIRTNSLLERILRVILGFGSLQSKLVIASVNDTSSNNHNITSTYDSLNSTFKGNPSKSEALVVEMSQVKQEVLYLENVISEIERKITAGKTEHTSKASALDKNNKSDTAMYPITSGSFIFLEVCVSLILVMLVCFNLYKFYQAKVFNSSRSLSTRHMADTLDNSNL